MAKQQGKEVAVRGSSDLPDFLKGLNSADLGVDTIGQEDVVIPRLKICQKLSKVSENVKEGNLYCTLDNADLGSKVRLVVTTHFKSKVWFDKKDRSFMGSEILDENGSPNITGPKADQIKMDPKIYDDGMDCQNYLVVLEKDLLAAVKNKAPLAPVIYTCASAALKAARQLNSRLFVEGKRGVPIYGHIIEVQTIRQDFPAGPAYMPTFNFAGFVGALEFDVLKSFFQIAKGYSYSAKVAAHDDKEE